MADETIEEKYTKEDNQSFKKFKKLEDWLEKFLFKSLENAWFALEKGGHLIINISDVYSNHRINKICDPMFDYMATLEGSEYQGTMGLREGYIRILHIDLFPRTNLSIHGSFLC